MFEQEKAFFQEEKEELLRKYKGHFLAISARRLIRDGEDEVKLARKMYDKYGYIPIHIIEILGEEEVIRMPSLR